MMKLACKIVGEGTVKNSHYFLLEVETENGIETLPYYGKTTPKYVSEIAETKAGSRYVKNIQPHVMRNTQTGKFTGGYRAASD